MEGRIWLIAGPTASGKSALALRLAQALRGEIVNADALQLYRDLRVLTARPSVEEEVVAPHHLFGVADAADGWSVGRWLNAARTALAEIAGRGRPAVVVGGTGLYFEALTQGLAEVPAIAPAIRKAAAEMFEQKGEAAFREALGAADPAAAARISPGDRQRLTRAWEVYAATGQALSAWQASAAMAPPDDAWTGLALTPPRAALYDRCDGRLAAMLEAGVLDEVAALVARDLDPALPAMKAVGLREFAAHLRGELTLEVALDAAQRQTRRYAKRQLTWLRGRMRAWPHIDGGDADGQWGQVLALHPGLTS